MINRKITDPSRIKVIVMVLVANNFLVNRSPPSNATYFVEHKNKHLGRRRFQNEFIAAHCDLSFPSTGGTAVSSDTLSASLHSLPSGEQARREYLVFNLYYHISPIIGNPILPELVQIDW